MPFTVPPHDTGHEALRAVAAEIGFSLLMYADIERLLKIVLPFFRREGSPTSNDPYGEMRQLLSSKGTLGPLVERLKATMTTDDSQAVFRYFERVVVNRNELVHLFRTLPFGKLTDADDCEAALFYLRDRQKYAVHLREHVVQLAAALAKAETEAERTGKPQSGRVSSALKYFDAP